MVLRSLEMNGMIELNRNSSGDIIGFIISGKLNINAKLDSELNTPTKEN